MRIRPATLADLERCERLDGSYVTQYVWQMDQNAAAESVDVAMRRVRIPRLMEVPYPHAPQDLMTDWQRNECFLVADEFVTILGYLDLTVSRWQWCGQIEHLVVAPDYRRQGVATRLLQAAERWARGSHLADITVALQGKNDPAITLFLKRGYTFCGFVDHYYTNGDMALLYSLKL